MRLVTFTAYYFNELPTEEAKENARFSRYKQCVSTDHDLRKLFEPETYDELKKLFEEY